MANKRTLNTCHILLLINTSISIMLQVKAVPQAVNVSQDLITHISSKLTVMVNAAAQIVS